MEAWSLHAVRRRRSSTWSSSFGMAFEVPPRIVGACATSPSPHLSPCPTLPNFFSFFSEFAALLALVL